MTKSRTPFFSLSAQGSISDAITTQKRDRSFITRKKPMLTDPRSLPQIYQRWLYQDYVRQWLTLTQVQKQVYISLGSANRMTGLGYWMRTRLKYLPDIAMGLHLDESTGSSAQDFSKNLNHGTVYGALHPRGVISHCLWFDGVDDRAVVPHHSSLDVGTDPFSLLCWFRRNGNPPIVEIILSKWDDIADVGYALRANTNGTIRLMTRGAAGADLDTIGSYCDDKWHHVVATRVTNVGCVFVDGVLDKSGAVRSDTLSNTYDVHLAYRNPGSWHFEGFLDEVRLITRALVLSEIQPIVERRYPQ